MITTRVKPKISLKSGALIPTIDLVAFGKYADDHYGQARAPLDAGGFGYHRAGGFGYHRAGGRQTFGVLQVCR